MNFHHLYRLHLVLVKRMRLILYSVEVNAHQVDASDVAVPCCAVVELHGSLVGSSSELCRAWEILWNFSHRMLASDRNVKVVQYVECLHNCLEACAPGWRGCLEECCTHKTGWGSEVTRETEVAAAMSERFQHDT